MSRAPAAWISLLPLLLTCRLSAGSPGAAFLRTEMSARSAAMGNTGSVPEEGSFSGNPAGVALVSAPVGELSQAQTSLNVRQEWMSYSRRVGAGAVGLGARYLSQGAVEGRDESGNPLGAFTAYDAAIEAVYGRRIGPAAGGIGVTAVESAVGNARARTWAVDLGLEAPTPVRGLRAGLAARNLGPGLSFDGARDPLPALFSAGVQYGLPFGVQAAAEAVRDARGGETVIRGGMEYVLMGFSVRGGWDATGSPGAAGWAVGLGWRWKSFRLDYAVTPGQDGAGNRGLLTLRARL